MKYRSLNESIVSVTNQQPKVVKEGRVADDTSFAVERGNKKKKWKISGGGNAVGFDALRAAIERRKIYKSRNSRATVKEDIQNEYIELLESALISIAEELECDVEDLVEMAQTSEREREMREKRKKLEKRFKTSAYWNSSNPPRPISIALDRTVEGIWAHGKKDAAEKKSKQMYDKGGKVVKRQQQ